MLNTPSKNSRLVAWLKEQKRPQRLREAIVREKHSEFLKRAQEEGYLLSPSTGFLLDQYSVAGGGSKLLEDIVQVQLLNMRLRDIGDVWLCENLQYCSLPGNYITQFDGLSSCTQLIRLDLHDNQISRLPGSKFWRNLPALKVLYLHNNSIGKLTSLQSLGATPNLQVLTLFDTPISLKKSYRHHVVNRVRTFVPSILDSSMVDLTTALQLTSAWRGATDTMWSAHDGRVLSRVSGRAHYLPRGYLIGVLYITLPQDISLRESYKHHLVNSIFSLRALDFHVISDEEIIEDARFGGHFSAMHDAFKYDPLLNIERERNIREERETVPDILREVSRIQARHSPVFIIQRYIRGFLGRCQARRIVASRVWAAVTIQRCWREYRGLHYTPPEPSRSKSLSSASKRGPSITASSGQSSPYRGSQGGAPDMNSEGSIDYSALMENRLPGSTPPAQLQRLDPGLMKFSQPVSRSTPSPTSRHRASLTIDLTKPEADARFFQIEEVYASRNIPPVEESTPGAPSCFQPRNIESDAGKLRSELSQPVSRRPKPVTVRKLLGPLNSASLQRELEDDSDEEGEEPIRFRISGCKSVFHRGDPTQELLIERRETGRDIRATHRDLIDTIPRPKPIVKRRKQPNGAQRLYARIHGTMGMSALKAVEQAYKDRERDEELAQRADYVNSLRQQRDLAKERRKSYLEDQRLAALQKRDDDTCEMAEALRRRVTLRDQEMERAKETRAQREHRIKSLNQDKIFAADFSGQHTSISEALLKHDRQLVKSELHKTRGRIVKTERDYQKNQAELVQRYLEHRKLMRQAQVSVERAALDSRILQEANDRLLHAQDRVGHRKQSKKRVQAFFPLPKTATDPILPPVVQEGKPDRFETLVSMYEGRIGSHPPVF